jgi:hypothetical protein
MKKEIPLAITFVLAIIYIVANYFTGNEASGQPQV